MSRDYIGLNRMKQAPHPLVARFGSLGLLFFGYVKGKLMEYRAETPSEFLVRIRLILAEIPRDPLNTAFLEWAK
jgi:hypothetical protein